MNEIPKDAIAAVAGRLLAMVPDIMGNEDDMARELLEVAETYWPHNPPQRDPQSTTTCGTERSWQPSIGFTGRLRRDPLHVTS